MIEKAVIYPIANGNYTDSNLELLLSLRSIEEHLRGHYRVVVISEKCPPYLSDEVLYVQCDGYLDALRKACCLSKEFLWMNDDISLIDDHEWDDFRAWVRGREQVPDERITAMEEGEGWSKRKGHVLRYLKENGYSTYDYSSHTPYLYESRKMIEVLSCVDFGYKTPFETAYGNMFSVPERKCSKKLSRHHDRLLPFDCSPYDIINYSDAASLDHVRGFLLGRFSSPSRFEDFGRLNLSTLTLDQIK